MAADLGPNAVPDRIAIDAHGYGWRVWDDQEMWSMVPQNPDNEPVPEPLTWFVEASLSSLVAALDEHDCLVLNAILEHYNETAHEQAYAGRALANKLLDALNPDA